MNLKEAIERDASVFLDTGEFADQYTVSMGGVSKTVTGVLDESTDTASTMQPSDGIYAVTKRFYVAEDALPRPPVVNKAISIDGTDYLVQDISREMGLLVLTLELSDTGVV